MKAQTGMERLNALLFDKQRQLVNVKFFPGNSRSLTRDQLANAAADMIGAGLEAVNSGKPNAPPKSNMPKTRVDG